MNNRMLVMSDIHGMCQELMQVLKSAEYSPRRDTLYVLGDYIDRGPDSRKVLDLFMWIKEQAGEALVLLKGNHEDMCIQSFRNGRAFGQDALSLWIANGGDVTLKSFGAFNPWSYIEFMKKMPLFAETQDFIFVHGGVNAELPLGETDAETLLWGRRAEPHMSGKTVVVGHSIQREVTFYPHKNTLYIDTGACKGVFGMIGRMSLVDLSNKKVWWLETGKEASGKVVVEDLAMSRNEEQIVC